MKIIHTNQIPKIGVSHNKKVKKKVILEKGYIPGLMTYGTATLKPGQSVNAHKHDTMFEVFHILSGKAKFGVNNKKIVLFEGDCITIEPGEEHSQSNPYNNDVKWIYFQLILILIMWETKKIRQAFKRIWSAFFKN